MSDLIFGPVIITSYVGPTNTKGSRIKAIHRRDNGVTWRHSANYCDELSAEENHLKVASELLAKWPYENSLRIVARGHDAGNYYFLCSSYEVSP